MPCGGCGGRGHSPGDSYGHIIGCGATEFNEVERYSPFEMTEQEDRILDALNRMKSNKGPWTREFAKGFAKALADELSEKCKE